MGIWKYNRFLEGSALIVVTWLRRMVHMLQNVRIVFIWVTLHT